MTEPDTSNVLHQTSTPSPSFLPGWRRMIAGMTHPPAPHGRRRRNVRHLASLLAFSVAALGLLVPSTIAAADHIHARKLPINEVGAGTASDDPCFDRVGRCGFVLKGSLDGEPADATFFSVIHDDGAANAERCVRATYAGLFGDGPDQSIGHTARGTAVP